MKSKKLTTGLVRLSYANVFTPKADPSGRVRYSASLIIKKSDTKTVSRIKETIKEMLADEEVVKILGGKTKGIDIPLHDGDEDREGDAAYANCYYLNAKASEDYPPKIFDLAGEEIVDKAEVYSGCYCQAVITFFPYNQQGHRGIGVGLAGLRKIRDGEPLSGSSVTSDDFDNSLIDKADLADDDDIF